MSSSPLPLPPPPGPFVIKPLVVPSLPVSSFTLSNNDQIMPRVYTRILFFFKPFNNTHTFAELSSVFSKAISQLLNNDYTHLFGRLRMDNRGRLSIYPSNEGVPLYIQERNDIEITTLTKWDHEETPAGLITTSPLPKDMNEPIIQFYFTLLKHNYTCIGVTVHHAVMDGTATFDFIQRLGTYCKTILRMNQDTEKLPLPVATHDRSPLLCCSSDPIPFPLYPHQEYKIVKPAVPSSDNPLPSTPPPFVIPIMKSYLFHLTTEAAERLKQKATKEHIADSSSSLLSSPLRISTNDAITALLWRCVTRARNIDTNSTMLGMATNGRSRIDPPLSVNFSGNANFYATSVASAGTDLCNESLHASAVRVRTAVDRMTNQYLRSSLAFLENVENITWVFPGFSSFCGNDFAITDWSRFPLYQIDFGWSGVPLKVRLPGGNWDGLALLFPVPTDNNGDRNSIKIDNTSAETNKQGRSLEIYLGLKEEHMNKLLTDNEWLMFMNKV